MIDTSWMLIFRLGMAVHLPCFGCNGSQYIKKRQWDTTVNIVRWTVQYLDAILDSKTQKVYPEDGTDWLNRTLQTTLGGKYWYGIDRPRVSVSGCWLGLFLNHPVVQVWIHSAGILPGSVANTNCILISVNLVLISYCTDINYSVYPK
jgi:hypothetical protein